MRSPNQSHTAAADDKITVPEDMTEPKSPSTGEDIGPIMPAESASTSKDQPTEHDTSSSNATSKNHDETTKLREQFTALLKTLDGLLQLAAKENATTSDATSPPSSSGAPSDESGSAQR